MAKLAQCTIERVWHTSDVSVYFTGEDFTGLAASSQQVAEHPRKLLQGELLQSGQAEWG